MKQHCKDALKVMRQIFSTRQTVCLILMTILLSTVGLGSPSVVKATSKASVSSQYITVSIDPGGTYTVVSQTPAWTFGGNIGRTLTNIVTNTGSDTLGSYQEIVFNYQDHSGSSRGGGIRTYDSKPIVLFTDNFLSASPNASPFPKLTTYPANLYHLTYKGTHAPATFSNFGADSPWMYFDTQENTFILSPASDFMIASTTRELNGSISSGITSAISTLPAGFAHRTFLVIGQGINATDEIWGHAMTSLQGKTRPTNDADPTLNYLGYWTDHGASYYYTFDPTLGYAGTLLAVANSFKQKGIPLGYMQLDSWWYPKGSSDTWQGNGQHRGGIYTYVAAPALFPNGLQAFQQQLGLPLVTHSRWIDTSSPYRTRYVMSNNVSTDPAYWNTTAGYLNNGGVISYEQDWLGSLALPATNLTDPNAFMNNMATSMAGNGITMQYCSALPRHFLQSSMYNNLTTIRVSGDRFQSTRWDRFLYTSRLAAALGIWPWSDVFMSTETDNLLLSTLSAGMVGVGDPIGSESASNLFQTIRGDGVIVKPDAPIVPVDAMYVQDAQVLNTPMVASTYTDFGAGMKTSYVFAYARGSNTTATFAPSSLGSGGNAYVYNYFTGSGSVVQAGNSYSDSVSSGSYYIVAPIGPSGIAFLGDTGKFVSLGKKRISQLTDNGTVQATIAFASSETSLTMHGYSPTAPNATASDGTVSSVTYNASTQLFSFTVSPGSDSSATITLAQT